MRSIKFRYVARHTHEGSVRIFTHPLDLNNIEDTIDVIDLICSEIDACTCCFNESQNHCDCDSILDHGEFEVISRDQSTGLTDKNGVEIYEGDILIGAVAVSKRHMPVKFLDDVVSFVIVDKIYGPVTISQEKIDAFELAVSGNIHQNPELLES